MLLIESTPGAGDGAASALSAAGHEVVSCYESTSAFPCKGVKLGGCPLDQGVIDVALLVRSQAEATPTPHESGVRCALRRSVPLALAGPGDFGLYQDHAAISESIADDVVGLVETAYQLGLAPIADAARIALRRLLEGRGLETTDVDVHVQRRGSNLTVTLRPGISLDASLVETASVRALAAIRDLDPQTAIIDVAVESPAAAPA